MANPTTQDLVKSIDLTGLTTVTGSEMNQLVDTARAAVDKGLTIVTTDSALDTPVVPNPDFDYDANGTPPTWWKRYLWIRQPFDDTEVTKLYVWSEKVTGSAPYLKWIWVGQTAEIAFQHAENAQANANDALTNALAAVTASQTAVNASANNTTLINSLTAQLSALQAQVAALQTSSGLLWPTGSIRATATDEHYSVTSDEGWLICDGSAVSRTTFATLFAAIGVTYGAGDGLTTFNVPNGRDRVLVGDNINDVTKLPNGKDGARPTRNRGDIFGADQVTLTGRQSGIRAHHHGFAWTDNTSGSGSANATGNTSGGGPINTNDVAEAGALDPTDITQPSFVGRYAIKT